MARSTPTPHPPEPQDERPIAVLDIDGVVADVRHRLHWIATEPRWQEFFDAAEDDTLLQEGAQLAHALAADHTIVWMTGRPERLRAITTRWLTANELPEGQLRMHSGNHETLTRALKLQWCQELAESRKLALVVDDDPVIVRTLRDHGMPVRQATWCPYSATYQSPQAF